MIENKWHTFAASRHFFRTIVPYVVFLLFATVSSFYRVAYVWEVHVGPSYGHHESIVYTNTPSMVTTLYPPKFAFFPSKWTSVSLRFSVFLQAPADQLPDIDFWLNVIVYIIGIPYLLWDAYRGCRIKATDLDPNEDLNISFVEIMFFFCKLICRFCNAC